MNNKSVGSKEAADKLVKNIRRKTARKYSAEEIQPVMRTALADLGPIEAKALLDDDVLRKLKRGLEVDH
jgi:hypothetical protein